MYLDFFHFARPPFANTADPLFFYPSAAHREALATLRYGIMERKGLCILTGPVGSGKTMILRKLMQDHPQFRAVLLSNPWVAEQELFGRLIREWAGGLERTDEPLGVLHRTLLEQVTQQEQARFVLLADEAHLLSEAMLEAIRLLLNLEEERGKLIQIVLSGQEELAVTLRQHHLRPLLQRVALVEHLRAFDLDDTIGYIQHRLRVAGGDPYLFPRPCLEWIHQESRGIPRLINQICDHALIFAFGRQSRTIERQDVEAALAKLPLGSTFLEPEPPQEEAQTLREALSSSQVPPAPAAPVEPRPVTAAATELPTGHLHSAAEIPSLTRASSFSRSATDAASASSSEAALPYPPLTSPREEEKEKRAWLAQLVSVIVALLLGAGAAYWWLTHKMPATGPTPSSSAPPKEPSAPAASAPRAGAALPESSPRATPTPPTPAAGTPAASEREGEGRYPTMLPLPVATRFTEVAVSDAKALLSAISNHFGADNTTVRDLFASMNPGIDLNRIGPNTRIRLPQMRRDEMIVADSRGRFYIFYATLADDQQATAVRQRLSPLGVAVVQIPVSIADQTVMRLYLGPFAAFDEAARVVELLRFTFLPLLERGEAASRS